MGPEGEQLHGDLSDISGVLSGDEDAITRARAKLAATDPVHNAREQERQERERGYAKWAAENGLDLEGQPLPKTSDASETVEPSKEQ